MAAPSGATPKSSVIYELAGHLCCRSVKRRGEKKVFYLWKKDLWMASDMEPSPFRNKRANGSLLFIYFSGRYSCVWVNIWRDAMLWETSCAAAGFHWTCDMPTPNKKWERINKLWPSAGRISSTAGLSLSLSLLGRFSLHLCLNGNLNQARIKRMRKGSHQRRNILKWSSSSLIVIV